MWRTAIITPIPKVSQPTNCGDYRPISVTPIMSRIVEKIVVRTWLRLLYLLSYLQISMVLDPLVALLLL